MTPFAPRRVLFVSDLHNHEGAYRRFAEVLAQGPYDLGLLGGDQMNEWLTDPEVARLTGLHPGDVIEDLPGADEDPLAVWMASEARAHQKRALSLRAQELADLLAQAGKPVFYVLGNHDEAEWPDTDTFVNLHLKRVWHRGRPFVGYRWTAHDRDPALWEEDFLALDALVDDQTVLVTHSPPRGSLDGTDDRHLGLDFLNRLGHRPHLHLVGHVHELAGRAGRVVNAAYPYRRQFADIDLTSCRVNWVT